MNDKFSYTSASEITFIKKPKAKRGSKKRANSSSSPTNENNGKRNRL